MATIKLTNGVLFDTESLKVGIDTTNVLFSEDKNNVDYTYTATQNCWLMMCEHLSSGGWYVQPKIWLNGTQISFGNENCLPRSAPHFIFLKTADNVRVQGSDYKCQFIVFGTK